MTFVPLWVLLIWPGNMALASNHAMEEQTAVIAPETQPAIPFKQAEQISGATLLRVGAILIFVLIVGVAAILLLKKIILDRSLIKLPAARIRLAEARRLSSRLSVYLVVVDGQEYLVSQSGDSNFMLKHQPSGSDSFNPDRDRT